MSRINTNHITNRVEAHMISSFDIGVKVKADKYRKLLLSMQHIQRSNTYIYGETHLKWPLKNKQNKGLKAMCGSLMQVKSTAEIQCSAGAFCNTFDRY